MNRTKPSNSSMEKIWFFLLAIYIFATYFAQDVLLPSSFNSIVLYAFLGFSAFAIIFSGKIKLSPLITWEIVCLILAFIAMLYSPSFSIFGGSYYAMIVNAIIIFVFCQMPWTKERFDIIMKIFMFSAVLLIIVLAITGNLVDSSESGRLGEQLMGNANKLAIVLMVSTIYAMWLAVSSEKIPFKVICIISIVILYIGMFFSGGRKFVIVPLIFLYILLLNKKGKNGKRHIVLYTVLIVGLFILLYQIIMKIPAVYKLIGERFEGALAIFDDSYEMDGSTFKRTQMIEAAFKGWFERPIFGHGFDSFKYFNAEKVTGNMYYSHNNFVELLYNHGLVGFIAYYGMYAYLIFSAFKSETTSLRKGFTIAIIFGLLFFEYFAVTYNGTPTQIMLFFAFYIPYYAESNEEAISV